MFDKEMMAAIHADAEKLGHLTGEDHTPEFLATCEICDGAGEITVNDPPVSKWSIDPPGVHEIVCEACGGSGLLVLESQADPIQGCPSCKLPYKNGDTCPAIRGGCPMGGDF